MHSLSITRNTHLSCPIRSSPIRTRFCVCMNQAYGYCHLCKAMLSCAYVCVCMNQAYGHGHLCKAMLSCAYVCVCMNQAYGHGHLCKAHIDAIMPACMCTHRRDHTRMYMHTSAQPCLSTWRDHAQTYSGMSSVMPAQT